LRILGIDPGLSKTGWGVLEQSKGGCRIVDYGLITTDTHDAFPLRLAHIYDRLNDIILTFEPQVLAVENVIYVENVRTALKLGHARGVILLLAAQKGLPLVGYAPKEIKESLTGNGNASKVQMQRMVQSLLGLKSLPSPHDVADAIAVAICHFHKCRTQHVLA